MSKKKTNKTDRHHLFYQARHWNFGYAKLVREHPYCAVYIPQATLHRKLHEFVGDIICPTDTECKKVYIKLNAKWDDCSITEYDTIEERLLNMIKMFKYCPKTKRDLERQLKIVREYYYKAN